MSVRRTSSSSEGLSHVASRDAPTRSTDSKEQFLANMALASRKDARDAVLAARSAVAKWSAATAYNRGQVLYRIAEVMEGRREQFISEVSDSEGVSSRKAGAHVDAAIDRWVWYAGWADKYAQVIGNTNPVAGPFFNFSVPEPTGVVAAVATAGRQHPRPGQRHCSDHRHRQRRDRHAEFVATNPGHHPRRMLGHFRRPRRCGEHPHGGAGGSHAMAG